MSFSIAVIGAGIQGLASALCLTEQFPNSNVDVIALDYFPSRKNICSTHGFGIVINRGVGPLDAPNANDHVVATQAWCSRVHPTEAEAAGLRHRDAIVLFNTSQEVIDAKLPPKHRQALGYRSATMREMQEFSHLSEEGAILLVFGSLGNGSITGYVAPCYVINTSKYLPWLMEKLRRKKKRNGEASVTFINQEVTSFQQLGKSHDLVVNCTGAGAGSLTSDRNVVPVRGQYISVDATFIDKVYLAEETVLAPRNDDVLIGGVYQVGRFDTHVDPRDSEHIWHKCKTLYPRSENAVERYTDVGIRPGRIGGARIETELVRISSDSRSGAKLLPVVHNYGHGAKGIAQHWGCALEVVRLSREALTRKSRL